MEMRPAGDRAFDFTEIWAIVMRPGDGVTANGAILCRGRDGWLRSELPLHKNLADAQLWAIFRRILDVWSAL